MKRILSIILCAVLVFGLSSCKQEPTDDNEKEQLKVEAWGDEIISSDPENSEYEYFFDSVESLLSAIKHDPDKYNNARVKVVGTLLSTTHLVDFTLDSTSIPNLDDFLSEYEFRKTLKASDEQIKITITNDAHYAVAETGDYVKLYGTVRATRQGIYIDNCEYDLIATLDERIQNVKTQNE